MKKHISFGLVLSLVALVVADAVEAKPRSRSRYTTAQKRAMYVALKQVKQELKNGTKKDICKEAVTLAKTKLKAKHKHVSKKNVKRLANCYARKMIRSMKKEAIKVALNPAPVVETEEEVE